MGHYCRICDRERPNEAFSGRGHRNHVCKKCQRLPHAQRALIQQLDELAKRVIIHTDGACRHNPGPGGWAAVLRYGEHVKELTGSEPSTTNNRMELQAAIASLCALKKPCSVELVTDSKYLRDGVTRWMAKWKANGWMTVERVLVKNRDLWEQLDEQCARHRVVWSWVRGHIGHPDNERCDALARAAIGGLAPSKGASSPPPGV